MSDVDSNPLDPDLRDALEVERVNVIAPGEAKARVFGRLAGTLGGRPGGDKGGSGDGRGAPAAPSGGALAGVRAIARPLSLAVSFGLGSVAGIVAWRATHAPPAPRIVYVDREPAPASASTTVDAPAPAPIPSAQSTAPTPSLSSGSPGNSLAAERALLDVARSAFGRGTATQRWPRWPGTRSSTPAASSPRSARPWRCARSFSSSGAIRRARARPASAGASRRA